MAKLIDIASLAEDLYYQDYAERDKFFDTDDFKYHCASAYSTMLDDEFQAWRKANKMETGFSNVELSAGWLVTQTFKETDAQYDEGNQRWYILLENSIFTFKFDAFGNGLNGIRPYGNSCNLKKISNQEIRFHDIIPVTPDIYYFVEGKKRIDFLKKPTFPVTSYYIPEVIGNDNNCVISDSMVKPVIMATLQLMFGAKQGNVVHEADDGNKNNVLPQQTNPVLNKVQQL
jgi:hypothetical protein